VKSKFSKILGVILPVAMILALTVSLVPANAPTVEAADLRFSVIPIPKIGEAGNYVLTPYVDIGVMAASAGDAVIYAADASTLTASTTSVVDGGALTTSTTSVNITGGTANFRYSGVVAIGGELIHYSSTNVTHLKGFTRGYAGTTAATHAAGDAIMEITMLYKSTDGAYTWKEVSGFNDVVGTDNQTPIVGIGLSPDYESDTTLFVATQKYVYQSIDGGISFSVMSGAWSVANETITDMDVALDNRGRVAVVVSTTGAGNIGEVYVNSPAITAGAFTPQLVGATRNVLAVGFSPYFSGDEGIFAVTVNTTGVVTTEILNAFGSVKDGGGWGTSFGNGRFKDRLGADFTASGAQIAFPDDFDIDSLTSNIAFVGLSAGPSDGLNANAGERGDVYKVIFQPTLSSTLDLNVRGLISTIQTATNIYSIDVSGDAAAATILVGTNFWSTGVTNYYWSLYYSNDSGTTWSTPRESQPTGGTPNAANTIGATPMVNVLLSDDFATNQVVYATTSSGLSQTSALSRSTDGGKSWRQISLVDWSYEGFYKASLSVTSFSAGQWYLTMNPTGYENTSYWDTKNGGTTYERFWSYANPTMPDRLDGISIRGKDKQTWFILNKAQGRYWRSTDGGKSFPRIVSLKGQRDANNNLVGGDRRSGSGIEKSGTTSLYAIHRDGTVRYSDNLGRSWVEPEESIIPAFGTRGAVRVTKGDLWYIQNLNTYEAYVSTDGGKKYLKKIDWGGLGGGSASYDSDWANNGFFYRTVTGGANGGVWKTVMTPENVDSLEWERIDNIGPTNTTTAAGIDLGSKVSKYGDTMYLIVDADATGTSGIWRSTNFSNDVNGVYPPHFEMVTGGLATGEQGSRITMTSRPVPTMIVRMDDYNTADGYANQLRFWSDTLNKAATGVAPEDGAGDAGLSLSTEDLTMTVVLSWAAVPGATSYEYEVARDVDFDSVVARGYTSGQEMRVGGHISGSTYYWRVRVAADSTPVNLTDYAPMGAPLVGHYSEARSYDIGTPTTLESRVFKITSPEIGVSNVSIQPTFTWTGYAGATNYEMVISDDPSFAILDQAHTVTETFYKITESLKYDTTYYWKVRGQTGEEVRVAGKVTSGAPGGPWISGVFTTEAEPVEETPAVITVTEPAQPPVVKVVEVPVPQQQPIPTALLVAIIVIGAVLVIALIVLIVRTRRVT